MSVLNKTLKNLEKRELQEQVANQQSEAVTVAPIEDISEKLHRLILPSLAVIALLLVGYVLYKKELLSQILSTEKSTVTYSTKTSSELEQQEKKVTPQPLKNTNRVTSETKEQAVKVKTEASDVISQSVAKEVTEKAQVTAVSTQPKVTSEQPKQSERERIQNKTQVSPTTPSMKHVAKVTAEQQAKEHFQAGKKAFTFGLVSEAIAELELCIGAMPEHIECRSLLSAAFYGRQDTAKASKLLEQGLNINPHSMEWRMLLAKIYVDNKQYTEVLSVLPQSYENQAEGDFWILKGIAAQQLNQHELALRSFKKLVLIEPAQGKWWVAMGSSAEALQQWQKALQFYTTATQVGGLSPASQRHASERLKVIRGLINAS